MLLYSSSIWKSSSVFPFPYNLENLKTTINYILQHRTNRSRVRFFATPRTVAHQAPLSVGFPRQEHWSGSPCPSPGDLPDLGIEPVSLRSPALAGRFFIARAHLGVCVMFSQEEIQVIHFWWGEGRYYRSNTIIFSFYLSKWLYYSYLITCVSQVSPK